MTDIREKAKDGPNEPLLECKGIEKWKTGTRNMHLYMDA